MQCVIQVMFVVSELMKGQKLACVGGTTSRTVIIQVDSIGMYIDDDIWQSEVSKRGYTQVMKIEIWDL